VSQDLIGAWGDRTRPPDLENDLGPIEDVKIRLGVRGASRNQARYSESG
jgi:hypothetical protein